MKISGTSLKQDKDYDLFKKKFIKVDNICQLQYHIDRIRNGKHYLQVWK